MVQMTLKEYIDHFQLELNNPASTLVAIQETKLIMRKKCETEINRSIGMI